MTNIVDGDVNIENGKLLAGYGINTVTKSLTLGAGSTYEVLISSEGATSLTVNGTAALDGSVIVLTNGIQDDYQFGTTHNILHADGGLTGSFMGASSNLSLLVKLMQDDNNVNLMFGTQFNELSGTDNQKALAEYLDYLVNESGHTASRLV